MKYMLLIYTNPENWATLSQDETQQVMKEYLTFADELRAAGELVGGDPLQGPETATTVRIPASGRTVTDGPFAETKEHLAGYFLVECEGLDRALALAARIPDARYGGAVEVRPIADM
ncbi:MAG TPA: YciI family protein [Actinomycetes bacterium]